MTARFQARGGWRVNPEKLRHFLSRATGKAIREPLRKIREPIRHFLLRLIPGSRIAVADVSELPAAPYKGRLPASGTQCLVYGEEKVAVRAHPLSRNSTTPESVHYTDHDIEAAGLSLENPGPHFWFSRSGALLSPEGKVWPHSFTGHFQAALFRTVKSVSTIKGEAGEIQVFHPALVKSAPRISDAHLLVGLSEAPNFGHFLLDSIPLIHLATRIGAPMLSWPLKSWQRDLCARLGVRPGQIRELSPRTHFLEQPVTSNRLTGRGAYAAHPRSRAAFDAIRADTPVGRFKSLPKRFYVMRGLWHGRTLTNRAELADALFARGVAAVQPELLSIDEQIALYAGAELIVAEFGAALANVVFCPKNAKLVEIICEGQMDPWSAHLCAMLGLDHIVQFQRLNEDELRAGETRHVNPEAFSYRVDVAAICAAVEQLG
jgi:capsular polysaccharide biosynthesis protein